MHLLTKTGFSLGMALFASSGQVLAEDTVRIGIIMPMTGPGASDGKQIETAIRHYMRKHGDRVAGKTIELLLRDDAGNPETAKSVAQDLIEKDKIHVLGVGLTPSALAVAPLVTAAKIPEVVMISGTSVVTERSPYIVRTSFTLAQSCVTLAQWAAKNGSRKVITLVSDWPPGVDAETSFKSEFTKDGGAVLTSLRVPFASAEFGPFLERAKEAGADTLFVMVPSRHATAFAKQYGDSGFSRSGIKLIGPGDLTDDNGLAGMGDAMLGTITAHNYAAAHVSAMNESYVAAFKLVGLRPNFISVGGYDGMHLIYQALAKTNGNTDGEVLVGAMKGMSWESPRGPISIDPETRDIVQTIYLRRVETKDGTLQNVEFAEIKSVKDPVKAAKH